MGDIAKKKKKKRSIIHAPNVPTLLIVFPYALAAAQRIIKGRIT